jgi:hypothetical protein
LAISTVYTRDRIIRSIARRINLWDVQAFEKYLEDAEITNGRREVVSQAYFDWCKWKGFEYKPRKYHREEKLPYIPREEEIDQLIASSGFKMASFFRFLRRQDADQLRLGE